MHEFDAIFICETFLNNTYEDNDLTLNGYKLIFAEYPNNVMRGEVSIYYRENLALKTISIPYLNERLFLELQSDQKGV